MIRSFTALATALLYFDLTARSKVEAKATTAVEDANPDRNVPPTGHPLDPDSWSDEDRPPGWYVDPSAPRVMRYWAADGTQSWSKRTTKTPGPIRHEWENLRMDAEESV